MASRLPGFSFTPAVAVGLGAAVASVLRLPLSGIVLATLLTVAGGTGDVALIIVGVVVAYVATLALSAVAPVRSDAAEPAAATPTRAPDVPAAAPAPGGGGAV